MKEETLFPIADIKVENRYRSVASLSDDMDGLVDSIRELGLLQPIVLDQHNKLLMGERRLEAHKRLGRDHIEVRIVECADDLTRLLMELHENIKRNDFDWEGKVRLQMETYRLMSKSDRKWSNRKQAAMLGVNPSTVDRWMELGDTLENPVLSRLGLDLSKCKNEDEAVKETKRFFKKLALTHARLSLSPEQKEAYHWAEDHYVVGDALEGLEAVEPESVDFVEVDPPYAVDLDRRKDNRNEVSNMGNYAEWRLDEYTENLRHVAESCYAAMKRDTFGVFWYATRHHPLTLATLKAAGFEVNPVNAIWFKKAIAWVRLTSLRLPLLRLTSRSSW